MNKVMLSGRIANELELATTTSGLNKCNFRIAVQRRFKNADGNYDVDFINCVAWRGNAEFVCKHFSKGKPIEIVGNLQTRDYEKDGQRIYVTEVVVDEANFVIANKDNGQVANEVPSPLPHEATQASSFDGFMPMPADDDLPF